MALRTRRLSIALLVAFAAPLAAQSGYQQPAPAIARILDAPAKPSILISPDKSLLVLLERPGLPSIAEVSAPEYRLAGLRLNPRTSGPSRQNPSRGISVMRMSGGEAQPIAMQLPAGGARVCSLKAGPAGLRVRPQRVHSPGAHGLPVNPMW